MAVFLTAGDRQSSSKNHIWEQLRAAISASSGFQRWQHESFSLDRQLQNLSLDRQVQRYLRETLETLAY
ncbi:hypothetical protein [Aliterella atlantica]|uniref:Uncharacterized protein n=1 Tax=Aliterella atlantica CENA595 TaxID=1618023 RepID=A0A0D8ZR26_9CYAN|nr:hypothetical protein [Aliterella atlantica]KJH70959.1 hypothetical protein UH38_15335 [Aliterella atlantica CENA595]